MIPLQAVLPATVAGALIGLAVKAAMPARRDLTAALDHLDVTKARNPLLTTGTSRTSNVPTRVGERLIADLGSRITLPVKDLNLLGITPAEHLGQKAVFALYGLVLPQLLTIVCALAGISFFTLPLVLSLTMAGLFWFWPTKEVSKKAAAARLMVRHATASYLERVALARIANRGAPDALVKTAQVGDGWIFVRMRQVFHQADLSGVKVWEALRQLGEELDIPELTRPADTVELAGEGAAVYTTLQAQARQLRVALIADAKAQANEKSATMILPVAFGVILMLIFVMIPLAASILGS
ncbi:hypothetical protein [Streptomyces sp. SGAir0957]